MGVESVGVEGVDGWKFGSVEVGKGPTPVASGGPKRSMQCSFRRSPSRREDADSVLFVDVHLSEFFSEGPVHIVRSPIVVEHLDRILALSGDPEQEL